MRALLSVPLLLAAALSVASADSLLVSTNSLGAATAATLPCTTAPLTVLPVEDATATLIASVSVGVLPAACAGGTLQVGVTVGATSGTGSITVPAGGGTVVVTLSPQPPLGTVASSSAVILGP
ncbi:MAG: hypothetical protein NVS3B18_05890 [Candidatus Dormibacteria bacterium]